ncbi:MAG: hypothetical protein OXN84_20410 [Albidovulum sp.]|nr:hypothetical protein [Albidovulum sp.]
MNSAEIHPGRAQAVADPRRRDHAAVADHGDAWSLEAEAAADILDLRRKGLRIGHVAGKHLHGDRARVETAQKAVDELLPALFAIACN